MILVAALCCSTVVNQQTEDNQGRTINTRKCGLTLCIAQSFGLAERLAKSNYAAGVVYQ